MIESDAVLYISDNWYINTIKIVVNDSGDVIFIKYELLTLSLSKTIIYCYQFPMRPQMKISIW